MGANGEFSVTIRAKLVHSALWKARCRFGTTKAMAEYLNVGQSILGSWLNLTSCPSRERMARRDWLEVERKLVELTGQSLDVLFPSGLRSQDFLDRPKELESVYVLPMSMFSEFGLVPVALPLPDAVFDSGVLRLRVGEVLETLTDRERNVIEQRFGFLNEDEPRLEDVAHSMGLSTERIRQIEAKALRKLRHFTRSRKLKEFII